MNFEYQISVDDYVAAQMLHWRLTTGHKRLINGAFWMIAGMLFILAAWNQVSGWTPILLAPIGAFWICAAFRSLFPGSHLRNAYRKADLAGKKFRAELYEEGFEVAGDLCSWRLRWTGVSVKGENKHIFVLFGANTIFMFGKKYLTDEQQRELRRLAGLPIPKPEP